MSYCRTREGLRQNIKEKGILPDDEAALLLYLFPDRI